MISSAEFLDLVRLAQQGDEEGLNNLARQIEGRLYAYIYRVTLDENLANDLLQETLLELVKSISKLRNVERFWPWLYKVAQSKIWQHYRGMKANKETRTPAYEDEQIADEKQGGGLVAAMKDELAGTVMAAMKELGGSERAVLSLRCFDNMSYSDVALAMDCSEVRARVLFYRAKKSLKKLLLRRGVGKGMLLSCLALFGKLTNKAQATVNVGASAVKVGPGAVVIGMVATKMGLLSAVFVACITVGGAVGFMNYNASFNLPVGSNVSIVNSIYEVEGDFEYPVALVGSYDSDGKGWRAFYAERFIENSTDLKKFLVGLPQVDHSHISLADGDWIELDFGDEIIDGDGYDVLILEHAAMAEHAEVYITDGAGQEHLLGTATVLDSTGERYYSVFGFDISGLDLGFVPRAIRVVGFMGLERTGFTPGFDLCCVRARLKAN